MNQELLTTHQEKVDMYMKLKKREIIEMLIESNRQLSLFTFPPREPYNPPYGTTVEEESSCLHDKCMRCGGTGIDFYGGVCVHNMTCTCLKCTPIC